MNPLNKPLEEAMADAIVYELTSGAVHVLDPLDLAKRAALEGIRKMALLAARIVSEMAADHEQVGLSDACRQNLRKTGQQIRMLPTAMARDGISRPLFADMLGFLQAPIGMDQSRLAHLLQAIEEAYRAENLNASR